jgi:predicted aminopeptidase
VRPPRLAVRAAIALLSLLLSGCATGYVLRAGYEEARLLARRQPIETVLAGDVDPHTRSQLELTLAARRFARSALGLAVGGSYRSIAAVQRSQIVQVVTAAPRDRLEPYTWWFPIVGRIPYRAYFDPAEATALAASLERDGYDTYVRPAVAFSTLGWFDDPLLDTLLRYDDVRLAETIFHELLHNTVYVPGQTAFNESFATFVGYRGCEAFFVATGKAEQANRCAMRWADALTFSAFLRRLVDELNAAYARGISPAERAALFDRARIELALQPWHTDEYSGFGQATLNNAVILHDQLYADRLQLFDTAYARFGGDLRATIAWVRAVVAGADDPFVAVERGLAQGSMAASRRIPSRAETTRTNTISNTTAANDAITDSQPPVLSGTCVKRLEKIAYTGQASSITTMPMNDMHRIMNTRPPALAATFAALSASRFG